MSADVWPPSSPGPFSMVYAGTEAGVWGPVVEASFIPDAGYRDIGNRGTPYHDVVTTSGAPVRVRTEFAPYSITAVLSVEAGSVVVTSYDLTEADLLLIVDGVAVERSGAVAWDEQTLPAGLKPFTREVGAMVLTQYQLQRQDGEFLSLFSVPVDTWQMPLSQRLMHADGELTEVAGRPALVYGYDSRSRDNAGAVYSDGELFYVLGSGPADASTPQATAAEMAELLQTLDESTVAAIAAQLELRPRAEVIGAWLADTPLPEGFDLTWMLEGPPLDAQQEAFTAHQVFACAWAGEWIETGDTTALDEIEASSAWPTAAIVQLDRPGTALPRSMEQSIEAAGDLTSLEARQSSELALDCSFLLGPRPR